MRLMPVLLYLTMRPTAQIDLYFSCWRATTKCLPGGPEVSRMGPVTTPGADLPQRRGRGVTQLKIEASMIVALAGGVGAAKFLRGLVQAMPPEMLTIISNTGDDIELFGLSISPDIDIVSYTLSGLVDEERGWGILGDTFHSLAMMRRYGETPWFNLGDGDLATH